MALNLLGQGATQFATGLKLAACSEISLRAEQGIVIQQPAWLGASACSGPVEVLPQVSSTPSSTALPFITVVRAGTDLRQTLGAVQGATASAAVKLSTETYQYAATLRYDYVSPVNGIIRMASQVLEKTRNGKAAAATELHR